MAKKFRDYYDRKTAQLLADKIKSAYSSFDSESFVDQITEAVEGKEFKDRQHIFAQAMETYLTPDYTQNLAILTKILGPELETEEGMFTHGYWLWPVGTYVERNAILDEKASVDFIYELTKRFTGEFAIRPLIRNNPKDVLKTIETWSRDPKVHVRRLSSEGIRISLPWASKMTEAVEEWEMYKRILSNLRHAPEKFVQKSVGNNLNDLMKYNRSKALQIIAEWEQLDPSKHTRWIIKHGRRSERKNKAKE